MSTNRTNAAGDFSRSEILPLNRPEPEFITHDPEELLDLAQVHLNEYERRFGQSVDLPAVVAIPSEELARIARARQRAQWLRAAVEMLRPEARAKNRLSRERIDYARSLVLAGLGWLPSPDGNELT
jgi:hypothetical protein